ncbi:MAG: class II SORL domain-containing protein [Anaerolineales bacterium]|nr:class II SORL domain-containing protein [Anaerolineales bacterium]
MEERIHVPLIEIPAQVRAGEPFQVKVSIGKEIPHPNTTEHHISWIDLYFHPEGGRFPRQVGRFAFVAHGEAVSGANQAPVYADPELVVTVYLERPGTFHAMALCNIHGLWQSDEVLTFGGPAAAN